MFFGPSDLRRYGLSGPITSDTSVDPEGTCRTQYGNPDIPKYNFRDDFSVFGKTTEIRNVEFHYHLYPDELSKRFVYISLPSLNQFKQSCPIWHFVDASNNGLKPVWNITVIYHGTGELPYDYDTMLNSLLSLMEAVTLRGYENVQVKVVRGITGYDSKCPPPLDMSMKLLRHSFENFMGVAKMKYVGDGCRMQFCPRRLAKMWAKQPGGGEDTRARSRAVLRRHQRRAKRGLRNVLKV